MTPFLHELPDFQDLIQVVADQRAIDPSLVEKDYWIMHSLWGLQTLSFHFELKGGTSLSKGFGVIHRFSEDIDIRIEPPSDIQVMTGRNLDRPAHTHRIPKCVLRHTDRTHPHSRHRRRATRLAV